ncbi:hypothetical protein CA13_46230 [Planctomycetes bacterium CA13]|uniref:Uncharacterized protein n=1 Tax=Novipirellula herctigrandis TaxID=2527986 RepID=A0A5C5Z7H8_9BACT|nr:hypothetical protein CA13_46230 [Planctomycetes bacterium CA13]
MKKMSMILLSATFLTLSIGCGPEKGAESVFDEDEMAKYRSTPEQIAAGMKSGQAIAPDKKEAAALGKETAKATNSAGK